METNYNLLNDFVKLLNEELKDYSIFKISEELIRYLFYKNLMINGIKNENIRFEANFTKNTIDKIDIKFLDNFLEIKFHRELETKNNRPYPYSFGKLLADFFKLSNAKNIINCKKYVLYVFDESHRSKIEKCNFNFLLKKNFNKKISDIRNEYNKTVNDQIKDIWKNEIKVNLKYKNFLIIPEKFRIKKTNDKLHIYFYEVE